jgi:hypothetical protein
MPHLGRLRPLPILLLATALLAGACSGGAAGSGDASPSGPPVNADVPGWPIGPAASGVSFLPVVINSQLAVGANRFLFTLLDARDQLTPLAAPEVTTELAFYDLQKDPATPTATASGTFIWAVQGQRGLYHATATFGEAGPWGVQVTVHRAGHADESVRTRFDVLAQPTTPAIGAAVPVSQTLTAESAADIARISTDTKPDPAFYRVSVAQALAAHQPFVLVFATPQFCQSQICGPTLDTVKSVAGPFEAKVDFIHVEPYVLAQAATGGLQPVYKNGNLQLVTAALEWGLPSEPWIFVVGADGKLRAAFEGAVGTDELTAAIQAVAGG